MKKTLITVLLFVLVPSILYWNTQQYKNDSINKIEQVATWSVDLSKIFNETNEKQYYGEKIVPTVDHPIILGWWFEKTALYVKNGLLYRYVVNGDEEVIDKWNNDFRLIKNKSGYFTMSWLLYYASQYDNSGKIPPLTKVNKKSIIKSYSCINWLEVDWKFFVSGIKQKIKFSWRKNCFESDIIYALYDNSWMYILEIPTSWELKYFPWVDPRKLKGLSEKEILNLPDNQVNKLSDGRWNIFIVECWPGGCSYTKK